MRRKKGQAAVEFLTTYGWALMAILLSIGVLAYFDFLSPDRYISQYCDTGRQIECLEGYVESSGAFRLNLRNNFPVDIEIVDMNITVDDETFNINMGPINNIIPRSESAIIGNNRLSAANLPINSKKEFIVSLSFRRVGSSNIYNVIGGSVIQISQNLCDNSELDIGEQCQGTNVGGMTCQDLGFSSGDLSCTNSCTFVTSGCTD
ncbi:MAG: hypothetical protein ACMXX6_00940 [Candidatus Woesearchaeota archaeon]